MIDLVLVIGIGIVMSAVGLGVGILVAGRFGRWIDRREDRDDR
jgi:hypothetical protein